MANDVTDAGLVRVCDPNTGICCYAAQAAPMAASVTAQTTAVNLDLSSTQRNIMAAQGFAPTTIQSAAGARTVAPNSMLTPAEFVALQQTLATGSQTLSLGSLGNATGGSFNINQSMSSAISSLVVPSNVSAIHDFANSSLNVVGNIVNSGNLFAVSTSPATTTAAINATNIMNNQGALISSVLPSNTLMGLTNVVSSLNLSLNAINNIINAGTIRSSGSLTATAGGAIMNMSSGTHTATMQAMNSINLQAATIINSGVITASAGNINVATQMVGNVMMNNTNGIMQAMAGNINFGSASIVDKINTTVLGGSLISKAVNIFSGAGKASLDVENATGKVNITACEAQVSVANGNLTLGDMQLNGDPTFYNLKGDVVLSGNIDTNGGPLTVVASRDIKADADVVTTVTTDGGPINMVAGANFTVQRPMLIPPNEGENLEFVPVTDNQTNNDTIGTLTISGPSLGGGSILLGNLSSMSSAAGLGGGDITLTALGGLTAGSGRIVLPAGMTVTTGGGDFRAIASNSINIGTVNASGGNNPDGFIEILSARPMIAPGETCASCVRFTPSGNFDPGAGRFDIESINPAHFAQSTATVTTGDLTGSSIKVFAPTNVTTGDIDGSDGAVLLSSLKGNVKVQGDVSLFASQFFQNQADITLLSNSAAPFVVGANSPNGVSGAVFVFGQTIMPSTILITNGGTGGIKVLDPSNASGALVILNAPNGPVVLAQGSYSEGLQLSGKSLTVLNSNGGPATGTLQIGGSDVIVQVATGDLTLGTDPGNIELLSNELSALTLIAGGNVTINEPGDGIYASAVNLIAGNGTATGGKLFVSGPIDAENLSLISKSSTPMLIGFAAQGGNGTMSTVSAAENLVIRNNGTGGIQIQDLADIGEGSNSILIDAGGGGLKIAQGSLVSGGGISLKGTTVEVTDIGGGPATEALELNANGSISLTATVGNLRVGTAAGAISTQVGMLIGGASIVLSAGQNLIVNPDAIQFVCLNCEQEVPLGGPQLLLTAGTAGPGNLSLLGSLNLTPPVPGAPSGTLKISTNSASEFVVGAQTLAPGQNGVLGNLTANGSTGGFIRILNPGGVVITAGSTIDASGPEAGGKVFLGAGATPNAVFTVVNNGLVQATNEEGSGIIGISAGPGRSLVLKGNGTYNAGQVVRLGNVHQDTLAFNPAFAGPAAISSSLTIGSSVEQNTKATVIVTPPVVTPTEIIEQKIENVVDTNTTSEESAITTLNSTTQLTNSNYVLNQNTSEHVELSKSQVSQGQKADAIEGGNSNKNSFDSHQGLGTGIVTGSGTGKNFFNLDVGNVVFRPTNNIVVGTHEGTVDISSGSIVFVMETGHDVAVYNLHDTHAGGVKVNVGGKQITVSPGTSVVLTRQDKADFSKVNPGVTIGHRNPVPVPMGDGIKAYYSEFSITSALYTVAPLRQMLASKSSGDRKAAHRMLKNAVILSELSKSTSPFKSGSGTP
jgi:hypothetical protein